MKTWKIRTYISVLKSYLELLKIKSLKALKWFWQKQFFLRNHDCTSCDGDFSGVFKNFNIFNFCIRSFLLFHSNLRHAHFFWPYYFDSDI